MSPRGRRPGGADTRAEILEAARAEFAEQGYDATSLRGIARRAGVDPALVHHYFAGKSALFAAVMDVPVDPAVLIARVVAGPRDSVGESMVRTFLMVWDSPEGRPRFEALIRSAVTHDDAARLLREFVTREIFGKVLRQLAARDGDQTPEQLDLRAALAASQMVGMAMMRYIVKVPAVAQASHDDLVQLLAPTIQRYLAP